MTKTQLVGKLAEDSGTSRKQAEAVIGALVDTVRKAVKKGDTVKIPDLGGWRLRSMKARMGRNPQTGEAIKIPARKKVGFTVAKSFKQSVLGAKK
ncbi:MAG: HU family DNA-binding protein [Deltaproteobacteria bacterium]|jgi:DNA-binding protein HU-beta|nr:HU family DNA-binding protein [Deltaproteobacteria bacterium]